jgi:adenosylcobinamide-GDP ribazoletransferase
MKHPFPKRDGWYARFFCAFSFLTRLRLPFSHKIEFTPAVLADSVVFFPVAGLFYSLISLAIWLLGIGLGLDSSLLAFFLLSAPYLVNRFLHFDGLCDTLDGFLADRDPEQRLAIMKDSRNGSFALGGAILALLGKFLLIKAMIDENFPSLVFTAPIILRWLAVLMSWRANYPRSGGTAFHLVGKVSGCRLGLSAILMIICVLPSLAVGFAIFARGEAPAPRLVPFVASLIAAAAWTLWLRLVSQRKIGGVTGDVLGCLIETGESGFLLGGLVAIRLIDQLDLPL